MSTATVTDGITKTRIGELIETAMAQKGLSIRTLAAKVGGTYENMRKIVRGDSPPSDYLLRLVTSELGMDFVAAKEVCDEDKIRKKYGAIPLKMSGKDPSLDPIERVWGQLTPHQQRDVVTMVRGWAKQNALNR